MSSARILIVDDNRSIRALLRTLLRKSPDLEYAGEAQDGEEAVRLAAELQPDAIIMDHVMPKMSGLDATREIKKHFPEIKVIGYTSGDFAGLPDMEGVGASATLEKKRLGELIPSVRAALGLRPPLIDLTDGASQSRTRQ